MAILNYKKLSRWARTWSTSSVAFCVYDEAAELAGSKKREQTCWEPGMLESERHLIGEDVETTTKKGRAMEMVGQG